MQLYIQKLSLYLIEEQKMETVAWFTLIIFQMLITLKTKC